MTTKDFSSFVMLFIGAGLIAYGYQFDNTVDIGSVSSEYNDFPKQVVNIDLSLKKYTLMIIGTVVLVGSLVMMAIPDQKQIKK